ncbi:hypothetical protein F5B20DRAFT_583420 [Whalleya microplaca]|nr:hypothetical protein F5B20DRAFT_583420 [Whalleya microplaca]
MRLTGDFPQSLDPAEAYDLAAKHATLLRSLFNHTQFHYLGPPTAERYPVDLERTSPALYFLTDFVQNTYVEFVIPFLPAGATRKVKEIANPWAYADPNYHWEWTWDAEANAIKDASGNSVPFPTLSPAVVKDKISDLIMRSMMAKKLILENETDPKARLLLGGQTFDFGEEVRTNLENLFEWE